MNERFEQLAHDAGIRFSTVGIVLAGDRTGVSKFAELIINECAAVVTLWSDEEPCSEGYDIHIVHKMKEHFGVTNE